MADLPLEVEVAIRIPSMRASQILGLRRGDVLPTPVAAGSSLDVYAAKARIGAAELATSSGRRVIRMVQIGSKA